MREIKDDRDRPGLPSPLIGQVSGNTIELTESHFFHRRFKKSLSDNLEFIQKNFLFIVLGHRSGGESGSHPYIYF